MGIHLQVPFPPPSTSSRVLGHFNYNTSVYIIYIQESVTPKPAQKVASFTGMHFAIAPCPFIQHYFGKWTLFTFNTYFIHERKDIVPHLCPQYPPFD
jgi:hypothetical protein